MAKRKQQQETSEDRKAKQIQSFLDEAAWMPEPVYFFNVGDRVEIGNLQDVIIQTVFEGGKFYEIDCTTIDNNYGNPVITPHVRMFWWWLYIRPLSTRKDSFIENEDLQLYYSQRQLEGVLHTLYYSRLNMNPIYQRGYVWTADDKILLIDSIMKNIDIGKFVIVKLPYSESFLYEILDGKQRINALAEFYENKFAYRGLRYNDLSRHEKYQFRNYPVSYAELSDISEQQKLRYFLMLNRTGKAMDQEHLAKIEQMLSK